MLTLSVVIKAILLGIVEGLTEFLPVSSTGHLILVGHYLDLESHGFSHEVVSTFEVFIQLGAILAVLFLYRNIFLGLIPPSLKECLSINRTRFYGLNGILLIAIAAFPALACGLVFHNTIKKVLFGPLPVAIALIVGGVVLLCIEKFQQSNQIQNLDQITPRHALFVGLFQCLSLWPGMSRSGSTLVGGLCSGLSKQVAAEFSFILAVPILSAAALYDLYKNFSHLTGDAIPLFCIGTVAAFIASVVGIRFFIALLNRVPLGAFGIYRIVIGALVLWWAL